MVIRRIGVWSVAKLYGAILASMGLLVGALVALASALGGMAGAMGNSGSASGGGALAMVFGVGAIVILPVFYGCLGLIMGSIGASLYNLFAGMFGGIELETEP